MKQEIQNNLQNNSSEKNTNINKRYQYSVIAILSIQFILSMWISYAIANGALSSTKNPLSQNILDQMGLLYFFWFACLIIIIYKKYDLLFNYKKVSKKSDLIEKNTEATSELKKQVITGILLFIITPILSALILYYCIYYIIFLFIGILPYIVGIGILLGLIYSFIKFPKIVHKNGRGFKIVLFTFLMLMAYSLLLILIYQKELGIGSKYSDEQKKEFVNIYKQQVYQEY